VEHVDGFWCPGGTGTDSWCTIKKYPEREPKLLSWYQDRDPATLTAQVRQMSANGINFIIFDWFWNGTSQRPQLDQALEAFKQATKPTGFKYAVMWENNFYSPTRLEEFDSIVARWIQEFKETRATYLTNNGKPVVYIYDVNNFQKMAIAIKGAHPELASLDSLLNRARAAAVANGFTGIHFVGGVVPVGHWVSVAQSAGFNALSAYNYSNTYSNPDGAPGVNPLSTSYAELAAIYAQNWNYVSSRTTLKYYIPVTTGWNKRPWLVPAEVTAHDNSWGTNSEFANHLRSARQRMDAYPGQHENMVAICCWNEYGEGSILEPIVGRPDDFLGSVKKVFIDEVAN
jgi:hypothetical protein